MPIGRVEARLTALGLADMVRRLPFLEEPLELKFSDPAVAARINRLLYKWLWFHPEIKGRVSLRLDKDAATLTIFPRAAPERRGRKGRKQWE